MHGYNTSLRGFSELIEWNDSRWPNFTRAELSCRHCGEYVHDIAFLDGLQAMRNQLQRPIRVLSAHRCALHNAAVGGAPLSQHLDIAADIAIHPHNPKQILIAARAAGFTGFGYYSTFLHLDMGRHRFWYGSQKAKQKWQIYLA